MNEHELIERMAETLQDMEWQWAMIPCQRGCCSRPGYKCPCCEELKDDGHASSCALAQSLRESTEYLNPPKREGLTLWDRIQDETLPCHEG